METARKDKRKYVKRTPEQRKELLQARIATLKACHATRAALIERLEKKATAES